MSNITALNTSDRAGQKASTLVNMTQIRDHYRRLKNPVSLATWETRKLISCSLKQVNCAQFRGSTICPTISSHCRSSIPLSCRCLTIRQSSSNACRERIDDDSGISSTSQCGGCANCSSSDRFSLSTCHCD